LNLYVNTDTFQPSAETAVETGEGAPTISRNYLLLFTEDVSTWIIVGLGFVLVLVKNRFVHGALLPDPDLTPHPPVAVTKIVRDPARSAPARVKRSRT
jgi:hypothetical protein